MSDNKGNLYLIQGNGQPVDFSNYSPEQLQVIHEMIVAQRLNVLTQQVQEISNQIEKTRDSMIKLEQRYETDRENIHKRIDKVTDMIAAKMAAKECREGWVTLTDFGAQFYLPISCRRVGKLFRVIGIAHKRSKTRPKFEYIGKEKLATSFLLDSGYSTYIWNYKRVLAHLNLWLEKHGYLEEFYSKRTTEELHAFIDWLHDVYVGDVA